MANSHLQCKGCGEYYRVKPDHPSFRRWCSDECAIAIVTKARTKERERAKKQQTWQKKQDKKIDKQVKLMKKDMNANNRGLRTREAQKAFNAFIRKRDENLPCISCGGTQLDVTYLRGGYWDCGHFKTVGGFPELRFEELNANKQCKSCNGGSGKFAKKDRTVSEKYKINLAKKIGQEAYDWVKGPHKAKNYTCADLKEIELKYKKKLKCLLSTDH